MSEEMIFGMKESEFKVLFDEVNATLKLLARAEEKKKDYHGTQVEKALEVVYSNLAMKHDHRTSFFLGVITFHAVNKLIEREKMLELFGSLMEHEILHK